MIRDRLLVDDRFIGLSLPWDDDRAGERKNEELSCEGRLRASGESSRLGEKVIRGRLVDGDLRGVSLSSVGVDDLRWRLVVSEEDAGNDENSLSSGVVCGRRSVDDEVSSSGVEDFRRRLGFSKDFDDVSLSSGEIVIRRSVIHERLGDGSFSSGELVFCRAFLVVGTCLAEILLSSVGAEIRGRENMFLNVRAI